MVSGDPCSFGYLIGGIPGNGESVVEDNLNVHLRQIRCRTVACFNQPAVDWGHAIASLCNGARPAMTQPRYGNSYGRSIM